MNLSGSATKASLGAAAVFTAAFISGCTSMEVPNRQLSSAETSIELAEQSGARQYGTEALDSARDNLNKAQRAVDKGDNKAALELATKAELDAELASAQASNQKTQKALNEVNRSIDSLRREIGTGSSSNRRPSTNQ